MDIKIKRGRAALILSEIREALSKQNDEKAIAWIRDIFASEKIDMLTPCNGQQHTDKESGMYIDNCPVCKNKAWLGDSIKIT